MVVLSIIKAAFYNTLCFKGLDCQHVKRLLMVIFIQFSTSKDTELICFLLVLLNQITLALKQSEIKLLSASPRQILLKDLFLVLLLARAAGFTAFSL